MTALFIADILFRSYAGICLISAALPKIQRPRRFTAVVRNYELLPAPVAPLIGYGLPFAELVTGILLIASPLYTGAYLLTAVLFGGFAVGVAINVVRRRDIGCGCTGRASSRIGWRKVGTNAATATGALALLGLALTGFFAPFVVVPEGTWEAGRQWLAAANIASWMAIALLTVLLGFGAGGLSSIWRRKRRTVREREANEWRAFADRLNAPADPALAESQ